MRVAGAVRDRLSSDNWRLLNRLLAVDCAGTVGDDAVELDDALELIDQSIIALVAVGGLEMAHMTRDDGWRFLSLGRHLERLSFVGRDARRRRRRRGGRRSGACSSGCSICPTA